MKKTIILLTFFISALTYCQTTYSTDSYGTTTARDNTGRVIGTYSTDSYGKTTFRPNR